MMCDGSVFSYHREMHLYCDSFYLVCTFINQYTKTILCVVTGIRGPKRESIWGHFRWVIILCPTDVTLWNIDPPKNGFPTFANNLDPDQDQQNVCSNLDPNGGMLRNSLGKLKQYAKSILSILNINCRHKKSLPDDKFCDMFHLWGK